MTPLRASQVETLRLVSEQPNGYLRSADLARIESINKQSAERKLRILVAAQCLIRQSVRPYGPVYRLTNLGREVLDESEGRG